MITEKLAKPISYTNLNKTCTEKYNFKYALIQTVSTQNYILLLSTFMFLHNIMSRHSGFMELKLEKGRKIVTIL